jgi:hypothetical protein
MRERSRTHRDGDLGRRAPRLTYANIVSTLALFIAIAGGSAYAASHLHLITGKGIASGTITAKNIKPHSLLATDFAPGQLPAGTPGAPGAAGTPAAKYWALIREDGTIGRQSGGISAALRENGAKTLHYEVTFPTNVSGCAYLVTASDPGTITINENVFPADTAAILSADSNQTVVVEMYYPNLAESDGWFLVKRDFSLAVFC